MADARTIGQGQSEASIDQVNIWMRSTPWYQQQLKAWGQDPGHPTLTKSQSQQILRLAQANGVQVDEGHDEIDDHGNFNPKGHKLRNAILVGGIAAATIATMGAAGAFSGAAGGAGAGAGAGATSGSLGAMAGGAGAGAAAGGAAASGGALAGVGHFLGSAAGLSLGKTLADTFTNIYGMKQQTNAAREALDAQTTAARYAADQQRDATLRAEQFQREQAETGYRNDELTRHANYDQYAYRANGARSLGDSIGFHLPELPAYVASIDPGYLNGSLGAAAGQPTGAAPQGAPPQPGGAPSGSGGAGELKAMLASGMDPQAAVARFNDQFKRTPGNQAVFYDASVHGKPTIGLPEAYLSLEPSGWGVTPRQGGSAPAAPQRQGYGASLGQLAQPLVMLAPPPQADLYQPGTLGAFARG